jgi:hypothetical protein
MKIILISIIVMAVSTPFIDVKSEEILNSTIAPIGVLLGVLLFIFGLIKLLRGNGSSSTPGSPKRFVSGGHIGGDDFGG